MPRPYRTKLDSWIENLILSYGSDQASSTGCLKAHVVGVGQLSLSEAQGSEDPTGLLFLSDGEVQIPAVLTKSAWEHLQEQEDRECFSSLVNTTVRVQAYCLQFHMDLKQTKCRFFLSVSELATTAAGTIKDNPPCCTTLPSVRSKIGKTWRDLLGQDLPESQKSQCDFNLSDLLGEWQHDCLQAVLQDVQERLRPARSSPSTPQPSTSSCIPSPVHTDACTAPATSWDADRVTYKGEERFSIPIACLLISNEEAQELRRLSSEGNETPNTLLVASEDKKTASPLPCQNIETDGPLVDDFEWQTAGPVGFQRSPHSTESTSLHEASILRDDIVTGIIDCDARPLTNPWDIFPPPCETLSTSLSSNESVTPEVMPLQPLPDPTTSKSQPEGAAMATSMQVPVCGPGSSQTSGQSKGEQSFLPPYQRPQSSSGSAPTSGSSFSSASAGLLEWTLTPSGPAVSVDRCCVHNARQTLAVSRQEELTAEKDVEVQEENALRKCRQAKRKRTEPMLDALTTLEEEGEGEDAQAALSPPSWLFNTHTRSSAEVAGSTGQRKAAGTVSRKIPSVHSDGTQFSYSYQVSGQCLQDLSKFKVADGVLHWAVKYLLPKQTDSPHKMVS